MKTAIITGVSGQGGAYLSRQLLELDYRVIGTSRNAKLAHLSGFESLGVKGDVEVISLELTDADRVYELVDEIRPNEIYHLASPSSVARSFQEPLQTSNSIIGSTVNLLEAVRRSDHNIRFFNAASTEIFGNTEFVFSEQIPINPVSPYGVAKSAAYFLTQNYRNAYGLFACSAIFSSYESPLRPQNYVTRKIVSTVCKIAAGEASELNMGNLDIERDWGAADEYMDAAYRMLQCEKADDFLIASGELYKLREFIDIAGNAVGIDIEKYLKIDPRLFRPIDIRQSGCDISKAREVLGWTPKKGIEEIIDEMVKAELATMSGHGRSDKSAPVNDGWNRVH